MADNEKIPKCDKTFPASWFDNESDSGQCCGKCGLAVRNHRPQCDACGQLTPVGELCHEHGGKW